MSGCNEESPSRELWHVSLWRCEVVPVSRLRLYCADVLILERHVDDPEELARMADAWHASVIAHYARLLDFIGHG